jgi:hypothetical protein
MAGALVIGGFLVGGTLLGGMLLSGCSASSPEPASGSAPGPAPGSESGSAPPPAAVGAAPALPGGTTAEVREERDGGPMGYLTGVRLARQDGFDRLVLEFTGTDRVPGYIVGYQPLPVRADGSGDVVPTPGAAQAVMVTVRPASGYRIEAATPTYSGPRVVTGDTAVVTQAVAAGDFEAVLNWGVGLRARTPFRVTELTAPPRLVVDFQHQPG